MKPLATALLLALLLFGCSGLNLGDVDAELALNLREVVTCLRFGACTPEIDDLINRWADFHDIPRERRELIFQLIIAIWPEAVNVPLPLEVQAALAETHDDPPMEPEEEFPAELLEFPSTDGLQGFPLYLAEAIIENWAAVSAVLRYGPRGSRRGYFLGTQDDILRRYPDAVARLGDVPRGGEMLYLAEIFEKHLRVDIVRRTVRLRGERRSVYMWRTWGRGPTRLALLALPPEVLSQEVLRRWYGIEPEGGP